jgi:hypothetical protein
VCLNVVASINTGDAIVDCTDQPTSASCIDRHESAVPAPLSNLSSLAQRATNTINNELIIGEQFNNTVEASLNDSPFDGECS